MTWGGTDLRKLCFELVEDIIYCPLTTLGTPLAKAVRGSRREVARKRNLVSLLASRRFSLVLGLALLLFSAVYGSQLRLQLVWNSNKYGYGPTLYELDPFQEYFVADTLMERGLDYLTYLNHYNNLTHIFWYPWGRDFTHSVYIGLPFFSIITYQLARVFNPALTLYEWMVYLPPLFFVISLVGVYLAVREVSSDIPAGLASLVYSLMFNSRQLAGFTVKYSIGLAFLSLAVYLHIRAWKKRDYFTASLAGVSLGLAALGWAGFNVVFAAMVAHVVLIPLMRPPSKQDVLMWVFEYLPLFILQLAAPTYGLRYVVRSVGILGPASLLLLLIGYTVHRLKISRLASRLGVLAEKPSALYLAILVLAALGGTYMMLRGGIALAGKALAAVGLGSLSHVLVETVAEYQPSGAQDIIASLGITVVYAFLSISYVVLSNLVKKRASKYGWYVLIASLALIVGALIYSRQGLPASTFVVSLATAAGLVSLGIASMLRDEEFFLVSLFALALVGSINISYFTYLLTVPTVILAGILIHAVIARALAGRTSFLTRILSLVLLLIFLSSAILQASTMWVRAYTVQLPTLVEASLGLNVEAPVWVDALNWIRESTPKDSVIVSWWDYGYWISVVGRRATVADGATINATQIEVLADALTSTEGRALDIMVQKFRIRPDRLYVVAYEVFLVDTSTLIFNPGPLVLGGTILGADAAKGIAAIYKIAGKNPPVYVYSSTSGAAVGLPDWTSGNLTSTLLYGMLLDAAYRVWGPSGFRAAFIYKDPQVPPEIPRPKLTLFEPAYISTSLLFSQGQYSVYVLLAVYKPKTITTESPLIQSK